MGVVVDRKFNFAYILPDGDADFLDMMLHTFVSDEKSYKQMVRIMNEKLCK